MTPPWKTRTGARRKATTYQGKESREMRKTDISPHHSWNNSAHQKKVHRGKKRSIGSGRNQSGDFQAYKYDCFRDRGSPTLRIIFHHHRKLAASICWTNSGQDKKTSLRGGRVEPMWWYSGQQAPPPHVTEIEKRRESFNIFKAAYILKT